MYNPTKNLRERDNDARYVNFWLPDTRGKAIETIIDEAEPMLDFAATRKINGKVIADLRARVRGRILEEKGSELDHAKRANSVTTGYKKYAAERYKRYISGDPKHMLLGG